MSKDRFKCFPVFFLHVDIVSYKDTGCKFLVLDDLHEVHTLLSGWGMNKVFSVVFTRIRAVRLLRPKVGEMERGDLYTKVCKIKEKDLLEGLFVGLTMAVIVPADLVNATQFYLEKLEKKLRRIPGSVAKHP